MARQPAVVLGFVGPQVVQNDVKLLSRIKSDNFVHEVQELEAPPAFGVPGAGQPAGQTR
jgi:hypothetical protein